MGQIIKSLPSVCLYVCLSFCLSVCHHSYGRNSHSILMKLYTIDRNPNSKIPFVGGQNPTIPSPIFPQFLTPIMHCQWQGLSTVSKHVDRLWRLIAQRTLLGGRYTGRGVSQQVVGGGGTSSPSQPLPFPFPSSLPFLPPLSPPSNQPSFHSLPSFPFPSFPSLPSPVPSVPFPFP